MASNISSGGVDMLHGPLIKKLIFFALPLAFTGFLQQLLNTADVFVLGRFVGKNAMAAVGNNTAIIGILINMFLGLSLGSNVVIARNIGAGKLDNAHKAVQSAFILAIVIGLILAIGLQPFISPITLALGVPKDVSPMAEEYLRFYSLGLPGISLFNFQAAIFRSRGDTRTPMITLGLASIINIILNLIFTKAGFGVGGVALATSISNYSSALVLFFGLRRSVSFIHIDLPNLCIDKVALKQILRIGLPASVQMMVFSFSNIVIQSAINSLGADVMAGSAAAFAVEINSYFLLNSFGQAATTFISQNYGAGNLPRCRQVARLSAILDISFSTVLASLILYFAPHLLRFFNTEEAVIAFGVLRIWYVISPVWLNVFLEILPGCLRGYGISLTPAIIVLAGICGTRLLWVYFYFPGSPNFPSLMLVYPLSWLFALIGLIIAYFVFMRRIEKEAALKIQA